MMIAVHTGIPFAHTPAPKATAPGPPSSAPSVTPQQQIKCPSGQSGTGSREDCPVLLLWGPGMLEGRMRLGSKRWGGVGFLEGPIAVKTVWN